MKVIVIGGVAAGMSAASKIKRMDPDTEVVVYEKGNFLSYGACGLPYYVGGFNDDPQKLIARTQEQFTEQGIVTHLNHEVVQVIPSQKKIIIKNHETKEEFSDTYDKLMVATGAAAVVPPIEGIDKKGVYQLKTLEDGLELQKIAQDAEIKNVVIVGGGYIGIELVDAFLNLGKQVTCVEFAERILTAFEPEISQQAEEELIKQGVTLKTSERVVEIKGEKQVTGVKTDQGEYEADLVIISVGIRPSTGFLKDTGIDMAENGALVVDREMRTSISDIWAAGDCSLVYSQNMDENIYLALGTVANKCGRLAGENILGAHKEFIGALSSAALKVCDIELGRTGMGEADAKRLGKNYKTVVVKAPNHPGYYPGRSPITIKVIYEADTKEVLGAQAVGLEGAVMRVNMFALAVQNKMTTEELGMTDFVYAPPFASVWDAVHIASNAAK